jgi:dTDP-4-dehydrorhamnose reductase
MMRVVIIGAGGQLARDLRKALLEVDLVPLTHAELDITEHVQARAVLAEQHPDVVINTAAFHRVDDCESEVERSFSVNALAVLNLARSCAELGATLVHLSTDYVFKGDRRQPYTETDNPNPQNVYGASKLAGEYLARCYCPKHFVVRSSGLYGVAGSSGKGGNFVELMLRLAGEGKTIRVVDDQRLTPTYTVDLAHTIARLIRTDAYGLYHATSEGECSWFEFAQAIFAKSNLSPELLPTTTEAFGARALRPAYSVLNNQALAAIGLPSMRHWSEALDSYLRERSVT